LSGFPAPLSTGIIARLAASTTSTIFIEGPFMRNVAAAACLLFAGALPPAALGASAPRTPQQVIKHHFSVLESGDLKAVVGDYADNATVITAAGVIHGAAAIREQFARMARPRAGAAPPPPGARRSPQIQQQFYSGDTAWLIWVRNAGRPDEVRGVETYIIRNGKIELETVGIVNVHAAAQPGQ
jgi:hypothetical protein